MESKSDITQVKFYKYRSLNNFERFADIVVNHRLYCSSIADLNDPMEGFFHANIVDHGFVTLEISEDQTRVCSLSSNIEDIRLWAHYADDHRGVAIAFQPNEKLTKVSYSEKLYHIKEGDHKYQRLFTKLIAWEYEKEYRYISEEKHFLEGKIQKIILGVKTPEATKDLVRIIAEKQNIPIFQSKLDTEKYKIKIT